MIEVIVAFLRELKIGARSLAREKGLTVAVVLTLALGIGANAVMFSLVRGVLLRPLVNRDEGRLIYIRQSSRGAGNDNVRFSVPEIEDLRSRLKTLKPIGDFSTIDFAMSGSVNPARLVPVWLVERTSGSWACAQCSDACWMSAMTVRRLQEPSY
jgi:putative ABC transport system permease protein